jgi:hypothetical protein
MPYAVILQYPGDGQLEENRTDFFRSLDDAVAWRDKQGDPGLKVFRVEPVSESAHWDWGTQPMDLSQEPSVYTGENAARSCLLLGYRLVKRRRGTSEWIGVDAR